MGGQEMGGGGGGGGQDMGEGGRRGGRQHDKYAFRRRSAANDHSTESPDYGSCQTQVLHFHCLHTLAVIFHYFRGNC